MCYDYNYIKCIWSFSSKAAHLIFLFSSSSSVFKKRVWKKEGVALIAKLKSMISEAPLQLLTISTLTTSQVSPQKRRKFSRICFRDLILYYCVVAVFLIKEMNFDCKKYRHAKKRNRKHL